MRDAGVREPECQPAGCAAAARAGQQARRACEQARVGAQLRAKRGCECSHGQCGRAGCAGAKAFCAAVRCAAVQLVARKHARRAANARLLTHKLQAAHNALVFAAASRHATNCYFVGSQPGVELHPG